MAALGMGLEWAVSCPRMKEARVWEKIPLPGEIKTFLFCYKWMRDTANHSRERQHCGTSCLHQQFPPFRCHVKSVGYRIGEAMQFPYVPSLGGDCLLTTLAKVDTVLSEVKAKTTEEEGAATAVSCHNINNSLFCAHSYA